MKKSLKIIRYCVLAGLFLSPFLVLVVPASLFFPFITGKNFAFRILIEIIFGLWLVLAIFDKNYRPRFTGKQNLLVIILSIFIFGLTLSSVFGSNFYRSFWSNYERMEGLITYLHLFVFFMILISMMKTEKLWKSFLHTSLATSAIVGFYGLLQLAGKLAIHQSDVRLDATLGNASYLAIYMVFHIFIALMYFLKEKEWYKWFYLPLIILDSIILYHTATRGAILGFIGGLMLAAFLIGFFSDKKKLRTISFAVLALALIFVSSLWMLRTSSFVQQSPVLSRFSVISFSERTTQSRLLIWKLSWEGFKENPVLGWGPENYNLVFNKYYNPSLWPQEPWFDRAHNVFFDRLISGGIVGLLSYLGLFFVAVYYLWLGKKKGIFGVYDSAIVTSLLAAYFFHNLFVFDNLISLIMFFIIIAYISSRISESGDSQLQKKTENIFFENSGVKTAYAFIVGIVSVFVIYYLNVPALMAARDILGTFQYSAKGDFQQAFSGFQNAISRDSFGTSEAREHLSNFAIQIVSQPSLDDNFKQKVYDFAVSQMKEQVAEAPQDIRYMIFLGNLYNKGKQYDAAIDILSKAAKLSPNKQQIYFELGSSYLNKGEYDSALEVLKKAFELDTSFSEARKIYAVSAIFAGEDRLADELMADYGGVIIADERFARAFAEKGNFKAMVAIGEKFVEKDLVNVQYRVSLAANYLQIGKRKEAIEQLEKAIELEPKFKQQGEYYINEIRAGRNP